MEIIQNSFKINYLNAILVILFLVINTLAIHIGVSDIFMLILVPILIFMFKREGKYIVYDNIVISSILLFSFPLFMPNPYLYNTSLPFTYIKYIYLLFVLLNCNYYYNKISFYVFCFVILTVLIEYVFYNKIVGNLLAELPYVFTFIIFLFVKINKNTDSIKNLLEIICYTYFLLPILYYVEHIFNIYDIRGDINIYAYGHWLGIISSLSLLYILNSNTKLKVLIINIFLYLLTTYHFYTSYQSVHYILIIIVIILSLVRNGFSTINLIYLCLFFLATFYLLNLYISIGDTSSWIYLKLSQVNALVTFNFFENFNSLTIRFAEFISIINQNDLYQNLFGRGIGSIYLPIEEIWSFVNFHDSTFPEDQVKSMRLQTVHEPIVMFIKWFGFLGSALVFSYLYKYKFQSIKGNSVLQNVFSKYTFILFILLFCADIQTCLIVFNLSLFND